MGLVNSCMRGWAMQRQKDKCRDEDSIIIAVMGRSGCGKSTFINTVLDNTIAPVSHNLEPETLQIQPYYHEQSEFRILLLDTPGSDATVGGVQKTLTEIVAWMTRCYGPHKKLNGIIYIHDIASTPWQGPIISLDALKWLNGQNAPPKVVLAISMWDDILEHLAQKRLDDLIHGTSGWKEMLQHESRMFRVEKTQTSAREILDFVVQNTPEHVRSA